MNKTSRFLSMILALVMVFAMAVPAFAIVPGEGWSLPDPTRVDLTLEDVSFGVAPIGTATIHYGDMDGSRTHTAYVFDQDVLVTTKDGRSFDSWECLLIGAFEGGVAHPLGGNGGIWAEDDVPQSWLGKDWVEGVYWFTLSEGLDEVYETGSGEWTKFSSPDMITKAYMDYLTANGCKVDFQPWTPAEPPAKPAPGVSVPLNDGSGEFAYTIKYGDTLSKIAAYYYYNDPSVYKLIYERNKDILKDANTIYAGKTIILPSYAAVAASKAPAKPEEKPAEPEKPAEAEKPAETAKPAPGVSVPLNDGTGEFLYTIKSGDSLSKIAAYYYGDMDVYKLIYERNKDTLKDANTIYAGKTIILPSYAAVAAFKAPAK